MEHVAELTREGFDAIVELRRLDDAALPPPDALHARLRKIVDDLLKRARDAGLSREDAEDLAYPVVALADEVAQARSETLRQHWTDRLLQLHYFRENVAGEAFFERLAALRRDPRRAGVLEAYYAALVLGFQGRYRVRGGDLELMTLVEELARELGRGGQFEDVLSPRGVRPEEARRGGRRGGPVVAVALTALAVVAAAWIGLSFASSAQAKALGARITAISDRGATP